MTTILFTFIAALSFALAVTPFVKKMALHFDLVDRPSKRKVHTIPVPRIGGLVIFFAFLFPFALFFLFRSHSEAAGRVFTDPMSCGFIAGAVLIFLTGLMDDINNLSPTTKFAGQILAALIAYFCGFQITIISMPFTEGISLHLFSLPLTVFWFVLVINAINLIDGLDGLAAGICFFVSLVMLFVCVSSHRIVTALAFASLAGSLLGFLRYNFNPATIFMGDSGSYFLGYTLAALSIGEAIKGQVATAMLIPIIALGVPLIDTLWAPVRRFIFGQKIFQADREHLHHRIISLGYTHRRAVMLIYIFTIVLGTAALAVVHAQDDTAALILLVLGAGVIFTARYIGMSDFLTMRRVFIWAQDISDEAGISHDRRSFLNHQLKIAKAIDLEQLWQAVGESLEALEFDYAEFNYVELKNSFSTDPTGQPFTWTRGDGEDSHAGNQDGILKIQLPLYEFEEQDSYNFGTLQLVKDMRYQVASHYTLKRVEHLRRAMVSTLLKLAS